MQYVAIGERNTKVRDSIPFITISSKPDICPGTRLFAVNTTLREGLGKEHQGLTFLAYLRLCRVLGAHG